MSLYVRVFNNFYTHRKTARLRAVLGNDALWVPPRLWAYAAENQPDGRFIEYTAKELAMLIGYSGNASRMLQALLDAGFMDADPLSIHDWHEHNGYHKSYAERASKAAAARWNKPPSDSPDLKVPDLKGKETSNASGMLVASNLQRTVIEPSVQPSGDCVTLIASLHRVWQERTGLEAPQMAHERRWLDFVGAGHTLEHLELVIEHTKFLNRDREARYRVSFALGKLVGDLAEFSDRLCAAQAWRKPKGKTSGGYSKEEQARLVEQCRINGERALGINP